MTVFISYVFLLFVDYKSNFNEKLFDAVYEMVEGHYTDSIMCKSSALHGEDHAGVAHC